MHYYQFNIADYRKDTMHLSRLEHGIYRDLIDWYYLDERPIPIETQSVSRRLRLVTQEEASALENVLNDFFSLSDDGYRHHRIDLEIADYYSICEKNKENGKKGGRPKGTKPLPVKEDNPVGCQSVASGNPKLTQNNPNQEPVTTNHSSVTNVTGDTSPKISDPDEIIFGYGVPLLVSAGNSDKAARSFLGGLRKQHGDTALIDKLRDCLKEKPLQPLEWLAAALPPKSRGSPMKTPAPDNFAAKDYGTRAMI